MLKMYCTDMRNVAIFIFINLLQENTHFIYAKLFYAFKLHFTTTAMYA